MILNMINVTIPVYNEEVQLALTINRLTRYLSEHVRDHWEIVIVDNASTDRTLQIAKDLERENDRVRVVHLQEKGRGRAVKKAWSESCADILSYMDVDLSTHLTAFTSLIEPLVTGAFDIAVGSRLLTESRVQRGWKREIISRCYNALLKVGLQVKFSDAQCGFKAISRAAADKLLPLVVENNWFFDTELLVVAETFGYRILDLPVHWVDDPDSRVNLFPSIVEHVRGVIRLRNNLGMRRSARHEIPRPDDCQCPRLKRGSSSL